MVIFSNCKINIGLDVVSRRPDGYHDISTCMIPVPWHDIIEILPAKGKDTTLTVLGNAVDCPPEKNLVMKAYRSLEKSHDLPPVDIILQKIVPDGAGLGGGSSDASHTLLLLNSMFGLGLSKEELAQTATRLGADCPFFIYNTPMLAEGIGEKLTPIDLDLQGYTLLIAKPESVGISTKAAYSGITPQKPATPLSKLLELPPSQWQGKIKNDFEQSIFPIAPQIRHLKEQIEASGATYTSMSGSGASVYGLYENDKMTAEVQKNFESYRHFVYKIDKLGQD